MFKFSKTSRERLETCDGALIQVMEDALRASEVDFGIAEGHRSLERQAELFTQEKTTVLRSKHNETPSQAVDIYAWVNGKANYETHNLAYIAGVVHRVAYEYGLNIRWGGNWNGNSEIITDQSFDDLVHFELN